MPSRCSSRTRAIAAGTSRSLVERAADVVLKERRKQLAKKVHGLGEEARTAIRQVRREANDEINADTLRARGIRDVAEALREIPGAAVVRSGSVGAVASLLLIVNEAQDIEPANYDKRFAPMAALTTWKTRTVIASPPATHPVGS